MPVEKKPPRRWQRTGGEDKGHGVSLSVLDNPKTARMAGSGSMLQTALIFASEKMPACLAPFVHTLPPPLPLLDLRARHDHKKNA